MKVLLHFSYTINFESFLSTLTDETSLQKEDRGFSLEDGPWKYKIMLNGKAVGPWSNLEDENSFKDLLFKLRESEGTATMIHVSYPRQNKPLQPVFLNTLKTGARRAGKISPSADVLTIRLTGC